jgi:threonine dehydrogenase-like Zn-dependent dehydrogenase
MAWYFELIRTHGVDVTPILSHRFRLEQYADAFAAGHDQGASGAVKMLFTFD